MRQVYLSRLKALGKPKRIYTRQPIAFYIYETYSTSPTFLTQVIFSGATARSNDSLERHTLNQHLSHLGLIRSTEQIALVYIIERDVCEQDEAHTSPVRSVKYLLLSFQAHFIQTPPVMTPSVQDDFAPPPIASHDDCHWLRYRAVASVPFP